VSDPAPLLLLDAPYLLYRAFFGLPKSIKGRDGMPVGALLGAVNATLAATAHRPPRAVVACFGQESASYRLALFPAYHAQRDPMPPELRAQFDAAPALCAALGWQPADHSELEADDLLASHAAAEVKAGGRALILTGDRDLYQCAADEVTVLYVRRGAAAPDEVTPAEVERRYGVTAAQVPDLIALRGDPSDGIPGAKGIGEKTAAALLQRHGSLEGALAAGESESPRIAHALAAQREQLLMFRELATLREVSVTSPVDRLTDLRGGAAAARRLGMERLAARLESGDRGGV